MSSGDFRKIMIATDGSELVKKAVNEAIELARLTGAKLYAAYAIAYGGSMATLPMDAKWPITMRERLRDEGREATAYVEELGKASGVEVESVILEGSPANVIVDFAEKNDIDLIVMGTLGRTGVERFLLGSVAGNVVRHSRMPVLVVKGEKPGEKE